MQYVRVYELVVSMYDLAFTMQTCPLRLFYGWHLAALLVQQQIRTSYC